MRRLQFVHARWWPLALLAAICLLSLGSRSLYLNKPCRSPCGKPASFALIFDENYYVNAARRILGRDVPGRAPYATAPAHEDPNAEHPQLGKLVIAAGIAVFGDRPLGWRVGSLLFGTIALLELYALVRVAGGSSRLALGATALMAADNLFLVHGRIATLDIFALVPLLGSGILYLRHRHLASGAILAVAACMKLVALYAIFIFGVLEMMLALQRRFGGADADPSPHEERPLRVRLSTTIASAAVGYTALQSLLDRAVPARPAGSAHPYTNLVGHVRYMLHYAMNIVGSAGAASRPWQWFVNEKQITYYRVVHTSYANGRALSQATQVAFVGAMNPFVIFLAVPALALSLFAAWNARSLIDTVAVSWVLGLIVPLTLQSVAQHRTMYLYYMLLVLPGVYIAVARMFAPPRFPLAVRLGYGVAVLAGVIDLYPFRTLTGL